MSAHNKNPSNSAVQEKSSKKRYFLTKDDLQNGSMVRCEILRILGDRVYAVHGSALKIIWVAFNQGPTVGCYNAYCPLYGRVFVQPVRAVSVPTQTVQTLRTIRHRNILQILDFGLILTTDPKMEIRFTTVTEWCSNRTLFKVIHKERKVFSLDRILHICSQIVEALIYLHGNNLKHCNLTSHTMFLLDDYTIKLGCFGIVHSTKQLWSWWSAPEERYHVPESFRYNIEGQLTGADIYAFGIVLYELLVQMLPYNNVYNNMFLMYQIESGRILPELPRKPNCTPLSLAKTIVWEQLKGCLKYESCDRPNLQKIEKILKDLRSVTPNFLVNLKA